MTKKDISKDGEKWLQDSLRYTSPGVEISPLGREVANLLNELFYGIYHVEGKQLFKVDWSSNHCIELLIGGVDWATHDFNKLTRLVFLAHHMALRVSLTPARNGVMRLTFHKRGRLGGSMQSHPTLKSAVSTFLEDVRIPEFIGEPKSRTAEIAPSDSDISPQTIKQIESDLGVEYAKSEEPDAGWFVYSTESTIPEYLEKLSSCECLEDAYEFWKSL